MNKPEGIKNTNNIVTNPEPITPDKALSNYQNYAYIAINDYLRKTDYIKQNPQQTKNIQNMIKTIDSEMKNNPLKSDKLVFRADGAGISSDAFEKTGLTNMFKDTFGKEELTLDDFIKNPKLIDKIREKLVGYEYTEKAYSSTGSDKENTMNRFLAPSRDMSKYGVPGFVNLIVPKGTPAVRIADYTGLDDELGGKIDEYLIGHDQTIVIDQVYLRPADDNRLYLEYNAHIKPTEIKENSAYLEEVTDFIKLNYNCPDSEKVGTGKGSCTNNNIPENSESISHKYTTDSRIYKIINGSLEMEESRRSPITQKYISELSNEINKDKIAQDMTVYRGISKNQYEKMLNNKELIPGSVHTNKRFTSTSLDLHVAKNFAEPTSLSDSRIVMQIDLPKGSRAKLIKNDSKFSKENEILIDHEAKYQFINKEKKGNMIILHMKYVK